MLNNYLLKLVSNFAEPNDLISVLNKLLTLTILRKIKKNFKFIEEYYVYKVYHRVRIRKNDK